MFGTTEFQYGLWEKMEQVEVLAIKLTQTLENVALREIFILTKPFLKFRKIGCIKYDQLLNIFCCPHFFRNIGLGIEKKEPGKINE